MGSYYCRGESVALSKRGVFFTFLAIIFVAVLVLLYTFKQPQQLREEAFILETRVFTMNDVFLDIVEDAERMLYVTTFRSVVAMEDDIANNGEFISNVSTVFNELFLNGSINGTAQQVMANNTFPVWRDHMLAQASKIGVSLSLSAGDTVIEHSSPWSIRTEFDLTVSLRDVTSNASWNVIKPITALVDIDQFEDPVYRLNTVGRIINLVIETNITDFVQGNDTKNLMIHTNNSWYREWTGAPSFLMRLEGRLNESSPYGIESLVDLQELMNAGLAIETKSIVDYIYFSDENPQSCVVEYMPAWWRIDGLPNAENSTSHPYYYEVEGLISPGCT